MKRVSLFRGLGRQLLLAAVSAAAIFSSQAGPALADDNPIMTNEEFVEQVHARSSFDVTKIDEVLDYVFSQLSDSVTVYPTENYYYFKFMHDGTLYAGNFRLDVADRDKGIIHFAYFNEYNTFGKELLSEHRAYSADLGLKVEKVGDLAYAVTRKGRTVTFNLNDLRDVKPPQRIVRAEEEYLGPVFDESGVQFFLLWNPTQKMFLYVLDDLNAGEDHFESSVSSQIKIGLRSGFAYYKDRYLDRWILIGVLTEQSSINSYFDGPFDQLPDNFVKGDALRKAFLAMSPEVEGQIDRFGNSRDLLGRMLADPYILYSEEDDLAAYDECSAQAVDPETYYPCFAIGQSD